MLKQCELRLARDGQVLCGAGGFVLRGAGESSERMEAVCGSCPIPDTVRDDPRACLHLRPVRVAREDGRLDSYFSCHWFYRLNLRRQPTSLLPCRGCPHWFPRPDMEIMAPLGYWADTDRIREAVAHPDEHEAEAWRGWSGWAVLQAPSPPRRGLLQRLRDAVLRRRPAEAPGVGGPSGGRDAGGRDASSATGEESR